MKPVVNRKESYPLYENNMKYFKNTFYLIAISALLPQVVFAQIKIEREWIRASPPTAVTSAAYMIIRNTGTENDRLISAISADCEITELHTVIHENGVMKMRPVEFIEIPADDEVYLKTGGYHVMLIKLKHLLKPGSFSPLTLIFEKAGRIKLKLPVKMNMSRRQRY